MHLTQDFSNDAPESFVHCAQFGSFGWQNKLFTRGFPIQKRELHGASVQIPAVTDRLHQLLERDSFLQSQVDLAVCAGRTNWAKRLRIQRVQLKAKMRKIVTATHKYASLFAASFDLVLYAALETTSIVSCKRARPLDSLSKRMALTCRHADYGRRLRKTCAESGCRIWDVPEVCSPCCALTVAAVHQTVAPECSGVRIGIAVVARTTPLAAT
jgi:hypothetical protein